MTLFSVVIPTTGRSSLRATLEALSKQDLPPPFEILVSVDGGPPPDLRDLNEHPECTRIHIIQMSHRQGVSAARNAAIKQASGKLIGFLDDDVRPEPDWLRVAAHNLSEFEALAGRIIEDVDPGALSRLRRLAFDTRDRINRERGNPVDYLNGGNCAVRADLLRRTGLFDTAFPKSQDRELARRIIHAGGTIGYVPEMVVHHRGAYTVADLLRGRYRAGRAAASMARHGDLMAVGPRFAMETYGASPARIALRHGPQVGVAAVLSLLAHRLGRTRPWTSQTAGAPRPSTAEGSQSND